jgi:hypothetical protein
MVFLNTNIRKNLRITRAAGKISKIQKVVGSTYVAKTACRLSNRWENARGVVRAID